MTHLIAVILLVASVFATVAVAQNNAPAPILPDSIRWVSSPNVSGYKRHGFSALSRSPGLTFFASSLRPERESRRTHILTSVTAPC